MLVFRAGDTALISLNRSFVAFIVCGFYWEMQLSPWESEQHVIYTVQFDFIERARRHNVEFGCTHQMRMSESGENHGTVLCSNVYKLGRVQYYSPAPFPLSSISSSSLSIFISG